MPQCRFGTPLYGVMVKLLLISGARCIVQNSLEAKNGQDSCICQKTHINGYFTALGMDETVLDCLHVEDANNVQVQR